MVKLYTGLLTLLISLFIFISAFRVLTFSQSVVKSSVSTSTTLDIENPYFRGYNIIFASRILGLMSDRSILVKQLQDGTVDGMVRLAGGNMFRYDMDFDPYGIVDYYEVGPFHMDRYEVSNQDYCRFLNKLKQQSYFNFSEDDFILMPGRQYFKNKDYLFRLEKSLITKDASGNFVPIAGFENHPVMNVSWFGAFAYALAHDKSLPTSFEWEYAYRANVYGKGRMYPFGEDFDPAYCNNRYFNGGYTRDHMANLDRGRGTLPVGSFYPNQFGLYDLAGNVWEWCIDSKPSNEEDIIPLSNPNYGPERPRMKIIRGGSWDSVNTAYFRYSFEYNEDMYRMSQNIGFRCVIRATY